MSDPHKKPARTKPNFATQIGRKAARKQRARRQPHTVVWSGLGMMGLVGWSVVVPTLIGAGVGLWLDKHRPGNHSWTLALLVVGLALGCLNAWRWVAKEEQGIHDDEGEDDD